MQRVVVEVALRNSNGLHARPAHLFVQTANKFASSLLVSRQGQETVNGKSIMGIMMLAAERGAVLVIECEGPDAAEQAEALKSLVEDGFGEE